MTPEQALLDLYTRPTQQQETRARLAVLAKAVLLILPAGKRHADIRAALEKIAIGTPEGPV